MLSLSKHEGDAQVSYATVSFGRFREIVLAPF